jgi:hypothetical protein
VALRNPKTDKVPKLSLAVRRAMGEIGNSLSRWCSLLVATFDMSVEVAGGFICARTGYITYDLATTVYQVSFEWRKGKKDHLLGFFARKFILDNTTLNYDCRWTLKMGIDGGSPSFHLRRW